MEYKCPQCGTDNIQKCSVAHAAGLSGIKTKGIGIGVGGGHLGIGGGLTSSTQQTRLSESVNPPKEETAGAKTLLAALLFAGFLLYGISTDGIGSVGDLVLFLIFASMDAVLWWLGIRVSSREDKINKKNADIYDTKWICLRCGHIFTIT